jgi:hypothetical protein
MIAIETLKLNTGGDRTVTVKLAKKVRKRLASLQKIELTAALRASGAGQNASVSRTVTLR